MNIKQIAMDPVIAPYAKHRTRADNIAAVVRRIPGMRTARVSAAINRNWLVDAHTESDQEIDVRRSLEEAMGYEFAVWMAQGLVTIRQKYRAKRKGYTNWYQIKSHKYPSESRARRSMVQK